MTQQVKDFRPARKNANKHTARGMGALQKSIQSDGWIGAMTTAADGEMIAGSARIEAVAQVFGTDAEPIIVESDGTRPIVVVRKDIPNAEDKRAQRLALADNRVHEIDMSWDVEVLAGFDADVLGDLWTPDELSDLGQQWADEQRGKLEDAEPQIDKAEELRVKWGVESGQLWQLGDHRLICGDCTDKATVARVMGGEKAQLVVTSPPYFNQRPEYAIFESYQSYNEFVGRVIDTLLENADSTFILAWNTGDNQADCLPMIADQTVLIHGKGLTYLDTIIWKKAGAVYSVPRSAHIRTHNYFYPALAWEPVIIFRKGDKMPKFDSFDVDRVSDFGINVWEMNQVLGTEQDKLGHPAMFPAELPERVLMAYSRRGNAVLEPFSGSGTTLIACERLGRKCRAVEILPGYCAVAIERWATVTGKTPKLIEDGNQ